MIAQVAGLEGQTAKYGADDKILTIRQMTDGGRHGFERLSIQGEYEEDNAPSASTQGSYKEDKWVGREDGCEASRRRRRERA